VTYTLDTNIVSYFIQNNVGIMTKIREAMIANNSIVISPVTYYSTLMDMEKLLVKAFDNPLSKIAKFCIFG